MALVCECNHLRSNHESGKTKVMDGSVSNCMSKDCSCKAYHANHETRQKVWKIRYKALFWSGTIILGAILAGIFGYYIIQWSVQGTLDQYKITQNYHFVYQFANGTINKTHNMSEYNSSPADELTSSAMFPLSMLLVFFGILGSYATYGSIMENEYKKLMREE